ncbi:MAG: hypothetical protein JXP73_08060 [Deltaproteobacteria bacterium]|jgi:hypothetical protein|nr:hypothetical protein [Deltaproteobacteria bacterium]
MKTGPPPVVLLPLVGSSLLLSRTARAQEGYAPRKAALPRPADARLDRRATGKATTIAGSSILGVGTGVGDRQAMRWRRPGLSVSAPVFLLAF